MRFGFDPTHGSVLRRRRDSDGSLYWDLPLSAGAAQVGFLVHKGEQKAARECMHAPRRYARRRPYPPSLHVCGGAGTCTGPLSQWAVLGVHGQYHHDHHTPAIGGAIWCVCVCGGLRAW